MIDWFTVGAQIINFLILVLLLKKFLYGPIIRAMEKREERITGRLHDAAERRTEAEHEIELYRKKNEGFEAQREELIASVKKTAEEREKEMLEDARKAVENMKQRWQDAVEQEKDTFMRNLRRKVAGEVYAIARKAFSDLADATLEEHMAGMFIKKIDSLDAGERETIQSKLRSYREGIIVATAFDIPERKRDEIIHAVRGISGDSTQIKFVLSKDLICGIELRAEGYTLGWNMDEYLNSLEAELMKILEAKQ